MVGAIKRICTKWGFWEEGDEDTPVKGGVSMLSHSNGSVAHGWGESSGVRNEKMMLTTSAERLPESGKAKYLRRSSCLLPVGRRRVSFILL